MDTLIAYPNDIVKAGSDPLVVRQIQMQLMRLGFDDLALDGLYSKPVAAAVAKFQTSRGLTADGVVGPRTWNALFSGHTAIDLTRVVLTTARDQIGVREAPLGSNSGPMVSSYLRSVGLSPGQSWCAAFVYWVYQQSCQQLGMANPVVQTGGCIDHWRRATQSGAVRVHAADARRNPALVKPGMIMILLINSNTDAGHTGIVEGCTATGLLTTIEGNSNELASSNGEGVYRLTRRKLTDSTLLGFIDYSQTIA